jgi:hypothetical protein
MDPRIVKQLDAYWSKAVKLAKEKSGDAKVVQRIFQNLLSMSKEEIAAWWVKLSPKGKQKYLEKYPGSKYAKKVRAARKKKVLTKEDKALLEGIKDEPKSADPNEPKAIPEDVPEPNPEEPKTEDAVAEPEEPKTEDAVAEPEQPRSLRDRLMSAWTKRRTKVVDTLRHHGKGLQLVKSVLGGEKVSDAQFEHAKKTATLAASLVLGAFAAVAVVTLAPALAAPIAAMFLEDGSNSFSYSSDNSEELASEIADKMYDWIMSQDQDALKKRLEDYNAK